MGARQRVMHAPAAVAQNHGRVEASAAVEQLDYASWFSAPLLSPAYAPAGFHGWLRSILGTQCVQLSEMRLQLRLFSSPVATGQRRCASLLFWSQRRVHLPLPVVVSTILSSICASTHFNPNVREKAYLEGGRSLKN
ncbi:hypothetical protein EJB05_05212, partial [Eragrostis curvula]